ncbi:cation:proton antiporter subunit C [Rickettsiales endosymbiont of Stachyamoeba lipophora]|uniref:cation:proton antiporter subunit C n=1 Tax=Rickettsiales endosymbiont of Stachyamoeba lipophora TaxID=2486578 RepID=UPI0013DE1719|nr:cation:proton antiporter subunit C [Rickettsiales endosymbiont of Stachyamoeba lipophora]
MNNLPFGLVFVIFILGIVIILSSANFFKKLVGLGIMQTAVIMFFLSVGFVKNSITPVYPCLDKLQGCFDYKFSNPLPQVLMLTAIVVGVAVTAVGLSLLMQIKRHFKTINENKLKMND